MIRSPSIFIGRKEMATYTAEIYMRTGLNAVNVMADKTMIGSIAIRTKTITGLTIRQDRWLSSIRVPMDYENDEVYDVDYMIIRKDGTALSSGFCYFVTGCTMVADDTAELLLVPDFFTTIGVANLSIVDGITVRSTYALDHIDPWNLDQGDSYISPSGRMDLYTEWHDEGPIGHTYIESTVDLIRMAHSTEAITCTDAGTSETITYPVTKYVETSQYPTYKIVKTSSVDGNFGAGIKDFNGVGAALYDPTFLGTSSVPGYTFQDLIQDGLGKIRSLRLESAILHQYFLPDKYGVVTRSVDISNQTGEGMIYYISELSGKIIDEQTGDVSATGRGGVNLLMEDPYDPATQSTSREANVLNFSDFCKYGLMSASGESIEVDPKDLDCESLMAGGTPMNPKLRIVADPRPEGRPYFRFNYINESAYDPDAPRTPQPTINRSFPAFFRNCIAGLQWKQMPLVFTQASGSALNTLEFQSSRRIADTERANAAIAQSTEMSIALENTAWGKQKAAQNAGAAIAGTAVSSGISAMNPLAILAGGEGGSTAMLGMGAANAALSTVGQAVSSEIAYRQQTKDLQMAYDQAQTRADVDWGNATRMYQAQKLNEMLSYGLSQNVYLPTVMFPYNVETLRDFCGNGCLVYRYFYSRADVKRVKNILAAYGAKYAMQADEQHFEIEQGKEYAYVETSGISLTGYPIWMCDGAAAQLNNGLRIWNVHPHHIRRY